MADEEFIEVVKRIGAFLSSKISNLFNNFDSRSVGTVTGLVFALFFTWKLLRSRKPPPQKRHASTSGTSNATNNILTQTQELKPQNVIDKPTLGQIVRQRLSEGRKVTCQLLGVVLEETIPEELQEKATVRSSVLEILLEITKFCDLYLMERVLDDESEKKVLLALQDAGVFTSGGLVRDKVLFCSTDVGRTSFVRQLEPDWHIDTNVEIVSQLARFIRYQLHVTPIKPEQTSPNVFTSTSLEQFFGCI